MGKSKAPLVLSVKDLKVQLEKAQIFPDAYSVAERPKDESLVLVEENGRWVIYYCERGQRTEEVSFAGEHDACSHFLERILKWRM